jgi:hypothetical protein
MSVLQQGVLVIDSSYNLTKDDCSAQLIPAKDDYAPGTLIAIQAVVGTLWWIASMFAYSANSSQLKNSRAAETVPIIWLWEFLGNPSGGYTAAMYLTVFLMQAFVSVVELIAWFFYIHGKNWWLGWWVAYPGWYAAVYGLTLPWIFSILQLVLPVDDGGLGGISTNEFGNNSIAMTIMNMIMWFSGALVHALMAPRLGCHIATKPEGRPRVVKKCLIRKTEGMSDEYYQLACLKAFKASDVTDSAVNGEDDEDVAL